MAALKFKKGEQVKQIQPEPMVGEVEQAAIVDDEIKYLVTSGDRSRWFGENEIEAAAGSQQSFDQQYEQPEQQSEPLL